MPFAQDSRTPIIKKLSGATTGVGVGQTAIVKIPPGVTYTSLILECRVAGVAATRAQMEAGLLSLRLTVSGVEKWTMTATQLIALSEFYRPGVIGDSGYLVIPFSRLWMFGPGAALDPSYGTLGESSFQLEIVQDAASAIDSIECWARISPIAETLGAHVKVVRLTPNIGALGTYYYPDLPKTPGFKVGDAGLQYLYAIHLQVPVVANLTRLALVADETRVVDTKPGLLNQLYLASNPTRSVQTAKGFVHMDFANRGYDGDVVPLNMNSLILEMDFANVAPGQINLLVEIGTKQPTPAQ